MFFEKCLLPHFYLVFFILGNMFDCKNGRKIYFLQKSLVLLSNIKKGRKNRQEVTKNIMSASLDLMAKSL